MKNIPFKGTQKVTRIGNGYYFLIPALWIRLNGLWSAKSPVVEMDITEKRIVIKPIKKTREPQNEAHE
ncbi:hypothetical protein TAGGR_1598 [Thermodesulfovibrio aggregans]|uniref:Uncharacterized protein n=1 Tax=Thermodesulfovibrio aggregans TaxID=86166 RepID=A0A0U9HQH2_9BACT|nr:hypothetical protein [Thermodesulfovibrio aggregans]GAQ94418.1 hypothetical protein TAGGR_1598 [Thermodesulfovibrio aggregans]